MSYTGPAFSQNSFSSTSRVWKVKLPQKIRRDRTAGSLMSTTAGAEAVSDMMCMWIGKSFLTEGREGMDEKLCGYPGQPADPIYTGPFKNSKFGFRFAPIRSDKIRILDCGFDRESIDALYAYALSIQNLLGLLTGASFWRSPSWPLPSSSSWASIGASTREPRNQTGA